MRSSPFFSWGPEALARAIVSTMPFGASTQGMLTARHTTSRYIRSDVDDSQHLPLQHHIYVSEGTFFAHRHKAAGKPPPLKTIYVNGLLATTDAMAVAEMSRQLQVGSQQYYVRTCAATLTGVSHFPYSGSDNHRKGQEA